MTSIGGESPILSNMLTPDLSDCDISLLSVSDNDMPEAAGKPETAGTPMGILWHEDDLALGRRFMIK